MELRSSHLALAGFVLGSGVLLGAAQQTNSNLAFRVQVLEREVVELQRREAHRDPSFLNSLRNTCVSNLKQIESAKEQWAIVNKKGANDAPSPDDLVGTYIKMFPICPMGGKYEINDMKTRPTCSLPELGHKLD
jgi:hypothetical protein